MRNFKISKDFNRFWKIAKDFEKFQMSKSDFFLLHTSEQQIIAGDVEKKNINMFVLFSM